jgi:two-component system nitrate/nitrite response regulator NarL
MTQPYTVAIVDDHPLFRKGLGQLLQTVPDFHVVGEAASGSEGLELVAREKPDILLLDLNMKDMNGIEVLRQAKARDGDLRVVMITVSDQADDLVTALREGADGYLLKDEEPEEMVASLQAAAAGSIIVSDTLTPLLAAALREEKRQEAPPHLTTRERLALEFIVSGMSNKLIGKELGIAEGTVKVHVKHLLRKLGLRSRIEAAVWAVANLPKR